MVEFYNNTCRAFSRLITRRYSTSFSLGIRMFANRFRMPIYSIYGFVRFADEIVDTFYDYPQANLLEHFRRDTWEAIDAGISLNPVLNAFQEVVRAYNIERPLIEAFLDSMAMDLHQDRYLTEQYDRYIYGSAEVVGLMCLRVFCEGNEQQFDHLRESARRLGAAFQKINFLRDLKSDFEERGRIYFPGVDFNQFSQEDKRNIEREIGDDFEAGRKGILQLPRDARLGVYVAYVFYLSLFKKIRQTPASRIRQTRIRVNNGEKLYLLCQSAFKLRFNMAGHLETAD
jgi:phytoene/squalene synthetase